MQVCSLLNGQWKSGTHHRCNRQRRVNSLTCTAFSSLKSTNSWQMKKKIWWLCYAVMYFAAMVWGPLVPLEKRITAKSIQSYSHWSLLSFEDTFLPWWECALSGWPHDPYEPPHTHKHTPRIWPNPPLLFKGSLNGLRGIKKNDAHLILYAMPFTVSRTPMGDFGPMC